MCNSLNLTLRDSADALPFVGHRAAFQARVPSRAGGGALGAGLRSPPFRRIIGLWSRCIRLTESLKLDCPEKDRKAGLRSSPGHLIQ